MNNGVIAIFAYNYGAQKRDRVLSAIRHVITYAVVIMILGLVIFQTMPDKLLMMFSASETMLAIGVPALRTISLSFLLYSRHLVNLFTVCMCQWHVSW